MEKLRASGIIREERRKRVGSDLILFFGD